MKMEQYTGSVALSNGSQLSYARSASCQPSDVLHHKDRQTLCAYDRVLDGRPVPRRVLEIGIYSGGSLAMWHHLWPTAEIVGVDITFEHISAPATAYLDHAGVHRFLLPMPSQAARSLGEFDLIIDDGEHGDNSVIDSFDICWSMLRPGGLYVVEDWHLDRFNPARISGALGCMVIGTDDEEHACDGLFPEDSAERVEVHRRLIAVHKRGIGQTWR